MNLKKIFRKLQEKNIQEAECRYGSSSSLSLEVFRGEISNFTTHTTSLLNLDAIIDNKLVMVNTEDLTKKGIDRLIDNLLTTAPLIEKKGGEIFKGAPKYKKFNNVNKELPLISIEKKKQLVFDIEKKIKAFDSRFSEVQVAYEEESSVSEYQNTNGVKLKNKNNVYTISAYVVIKDGEETKDSFLLFISNDFNAFDIDAFVKEVCEDAIKKLKPARLTSGKYRVVFDPSVVTILLGCYISQLNAEQILKNSSWFKDKINTQVANKRVTIIETPLKRDINFQNADAQGVPCTNRQLIKKGVLLTYLHNLETARKFNVEPTGHAAINGLKIGIAPRSALHLKPGRLSKEELIAEVKDGVYITDLEGLHAGMNAQSGDFSMKAEGFVIKDGKLSSALDMMTVTSNLFAIFNNVKKISQNIEYIKKGISAPCLYINNVAISF